MSPSKRSHAFGSLAALHRSSNFQPPGSMRSTPTNQTLSLQFGEGYLGHNTRLSTTIGCFFFTHFFTRHQTQCGPSNIWAQLTISRADNIPVYAKLSREVYVALGVQFLGITSWAVRVCLPDKVVSRTEKGPTSGPGVRLHVAPQTCCMSRHCAEFACIHIEVRFQLVTPNKSHQRTKKVYFSFHSSNLRKSPRKERKKRVRKSP